MNSHVADEGATTGDELKNDHKQLILQRNHLDGGSRCNLQNQDQ